MGDGIQIGRQLRGAGALLEVLRASHSLPAAGGGADDASGNETAPDKSAEVPKAE